MFTKTRDWRRWSGPRTELTAAVEFASKELQQWSGIPSKVRVRISFNNQLTESSDDPTALDLVHATDLRRIKEIWIDVETDSAWWQQRRNEYHESEIDLRLSGKVAEAAALPKPPELILSNVSLRLVGGGGVITAIRIVVLGPDRTKVEGLMTMLAEVLNRSASGPTNLPTAWGPAVVFPAAFVAWFLGLETVRGWRLAPGDGRWDWQEIVIPIAAAIVAAGVALSLWWVFPSLELLDSGQRSRFQRYRAMLFVGLGAIITSLVAAAIWAAVT